MVFFTEIEQTLLRLHGDVKDHAIPNCLADPGKGQAGGVSLPLFALPLVTLQFPKHPGNRFRNHRNQTESPESNPTRMQSVNRLKGAKGEDSPKETVLEKLNTTCQRWALDTIDTAHKTH